MALFIMIADADGGGANNFLVSAPNEAAAYDYMANLNLENIGCAVSDATAQDVEEFLNDQYNCMAVLASV